MTDRPLRILHVASHAKVARGGAVQMVRVAAEHHRRGHRVHCVVHHGREHTRSLEHDFSELFDAGVDVTAFDQDRLLEALRFRRWLRGHPFDVLHAHRDRALLFAHRATWRMSRPALVANRGTTNPIPRRSVRRAFCSPRLRAVVAVAEAVRQSLVDHYAIDPTLIHVIYGSVETDRFHPGVDGSGIREEIGIAPGTPLVGLPAALVPKKGHEDFVRMVPEVLAAVPQTHFLWVGEGKETRFQELIQGLDQAGRIHWLRHRDDMPEILAACSVVLCCSTWGEGLTGTLREALAMARPVITTDVSGNPEIVQDGVTGRVVPAGAPPAMARAVIDVLRDPGSALRLAAAGREWVRRECSNATRADRLESLYRRLVAG